MIKSDSASVAHLFARMGAPNCLSLLKSLSERWEKVPILVACLDQGSVGNAGMAFALRNHMVHVKFDKIHRSIRDYKLAIGRACGGQFLRTQLHSSYVFSLNYKPFGTGGFFQRKQSMSESFLASHSTNSEIWIRYCELIALDMGLSSLNVPDNELWDRMLQLPSFSKKGALVKLARWFSWSEVCNEMLAEYHAFKIVLEDLLELDDESNPSSVLPTGQGPSMNDPTSADQGLLNAAAMKGNQPQRRAEPHEENDGRIQACVEADDGALVLSFPHFA